ncbi:MAG: hypothetical protein ACLUUG_08675 [Lachnospiraceae bacterium]
MKEIASRGYSAGSSFKMGIFHQQILDNLKMGLFCFSMKKDSKIND